ncbi:MAG: AAA family ATPase [Methanomicrobiales archaeon]
MLWIERYRPKEFREILGQDPSVGLLSSFAENKTLPHLILTGAHGTGKSVAIECFARKLYGENWELNTSRFQTADLFSQGKAYLENDDRYTHIYQKGQSLINNFKYIIKWYASLRPLDTEFKLMIFEDAHTLTLDAQQALRRIMERSSGTCRFVFTTTNQSSIIPAITSRCLPLFFAPLDQSVMLNHLRTIKACEPLGKQGCSDDEFELIIQAAHGDMRRAILLLQVALETGKCDQLFEMDQSETVNISASAIKAIKDGDIRGAIRRLESLMIDYGLSGSEVLGQIRIITRRECNHPEIAIALADAELKMRHSNNEFVQIGAFTTKILTVLS